MKAIIMAGGRGTRLYPVSLRKPKPMVNLFETPVMEHILALLKKHGIKDVCATLQYMPKHVMEYFREHPMVGMNLSFSIEKEPLGTAGSVGLCRKFVGDDDVLIISGDAVTDLDLTALLQKHRDLRAEATLALYRHPSPLEYGLVMTDESGKITRFIEKPSWKQVFCDTVNTGIYVLKSDVLKRIPDDRPSDFAKDIFPAMLREGRALYGAVVPGYWCDMGDARAYLQCHEDALRGGVFLRLRAPQRAPGVYAKSEPPSSVKIYPPVYIGGDVTMEPGAEIGPFAVLLGQSYISRGAKVRHSVVEGAYVGREAELRGTVVLPGAVVHREAALSDGSVIGENAEIGREASVLEGVRVWPGVRVTERSELRKSIALGTGRTGPVFSEEGLITGELNGDITPGTLLTLGAVSTKAFSSCAISADSKVGRVLAESFAIGFSGAGGRVTLTDSATAAEGVFAAKRCGLDASIYVEASGDEVSVWFTDDDGLPISRAAERTIEGAAARGEIPPVEPGSARIPARLVGISEAYPKSIRVRGGEGVSVFVDCGNQGGLALSEALIRAGYDVRRRRAGVLSIGVSDDGRRPVLYDEDGRNIPSDRVVCILALSELLRGKRTIALPSDAPAAAEEFAVSNGATVLRQGRDEGAEALLREAACYRDGCAAAAVILSTVVHFKTSVSALASSVPEFSRKTVEIPLRSDRGQVMRSLLSAYGENCPELANGARMHVPGGWISVQPLVSRPSIRILSEGLSAEAAEELLVEAKTRTIALDREAESEEI